MVPGGQGGNKSTIAEMKRINALNLEPTIPKADDRGQSRLVLKESATRTGAKSESMKREFENSLSQIKRQEKSQQAKRNQAGGANLNPHAGEFMPSSATGSGGGGGGGPGAGHPHAKGGDAAPQFQISIFSSQGQKSLVDLFDPFYQLAKGKPPDQEVPRWPDAKGPSYKELLGKPDPSHPTVQMQHASQPGPQGWPQQMQQMPNMPPQMQHPQQQQQQQHQQQHLQNLQQLQQQQRQQQQEHMLQQQFQQHHLQHQLQLRQQRQQQQWSDPYAQSKHSPAAQHAQGFSHGAAGAATGSAMSPQWAMREDEAPLGAGAVADGCPHCPAALQAFHGAVGPTGPPGQAIADPASGFVAAASPPSEIASLATAFMESRAARASKHAAAAAAFGQTGLAEEDWFALS